MVDWPSLDWTALGLAVACNLAIGAIWYQRRVFGGVWIRLRDANRAEARIHPAGNLARAAGLNLLGGTLAAAALLVVLMAFLATPWGFANAEGTLDAGPAMLGALLVWGGFFLPSLLTGFVWERKPLALLLIHAGYQVASLSAGALVYAARL